MNLNLFSDLYNLGYYILTCLCGVNFLSWVFYEYIICPFIVLEISYFNLLIQFTYFVDELFEKFIYFRGMGYFGGTPGDTQAFLLTLTQELLLEVFREP